MDTMLILTIACHSHYACARSLIGRPADPLIPIPHPLVRRCRSALHPYEPLSMSSPTVPPQALLCLCLGNICRSPLAEGIIRREVETRKLQGWVREGEEREKTDARLERTNGVQVQSGWQPSIVPLATGHVHLDS